MSANGLLRKDQLERSLHDEKKLIEEGILKEDNPLDFSENFQKLCSACRRGDLKVCQEMIQEGTNINAKDQYDYTPLILTSDISVVTALESFHLHKFILSARSPYFRSKLSAAPDTTSWKLPSTIPPQSLGIALKHLYLGEMPRELGGGPGTGFTDSEVLAGVDRISKHLEIQNLSQLILDSNDRRLARQRRQDEVEKGRDQLEQWFRENVLKHAIRTDTSRADSIKWDRDNGIFADVLLRADEDEPQNDDDLFSVVDNSNRPRTTTSTNTLGIPLDEPASRNSRAPSPSRRPRRCRIYPCHKAMLIRSEFFMTMFESPFREAQHTPHLQVVPIDCSPQVLEVILTFLYTEQTNFGLDVAVDVLFAADMLFLEKVKAKAALVVSTLGNGTATAMAPEDGPTREDEDIDVYEILRAAWLTRVQRLEEFAARYMAYRLEAFIDDPEFAELVKESAGRISARQETDSIELLDDIRYYLSERFRLRFEDSGLEDVMDEEAAVANALADAGAGASFAQVDGSLVPATGTAAAAGLSKEHVDDEGVDMSGSGPPENVLGAEATAESLLQSGAVRTLDGELAGDEFAADAVNYQILLGKIDSLLERLKLDA
ncbi:hypothetical protein H2204_006430 [Knufia peltigerae]|uniref:BTB domain-containing protein n=1 Tax=Knufia peltigerae TaxID=1002370 RepID=A0AA38Y4R2_9EURO|nr:hypothetical protein H2204_006430 [Knufia peltigerae]